MKPNPIPPGYHTVTPYFFVQGAARAIEFYKQVFGATEKMRMPGPSGAIMHAELQIGDSVIMLADENPQFGAFAPGHYKGTPVKMNLDVPDCDAVFNAAVAAGAKVVKPLENQFYGDRSGMVEDPFGHGWNVASHVEDVSDEEIRRRMEAMMSQHGGGKNA